MRFLIESLRFKTTKRAGIQGKKPKDDLNSSWAETVRGVDRLSLLILFDAKIEIL